MIRKLVLFTTMIVMLLSTKVNASEVPVNHVKNTIVRHSVALGVDPAIALSIAASCESGNARLSVLSFHSPTSNIDEFLLYILV